MADVRKELNFCQKTKVPVMGVVENMGEYTTTLDQLTFAKTSTNESTQKEDCTQKILETLQKHCPELFEGESKISVSSTLYPASGGGPKAMAERYNVPYWGLLPMDPDLLQACEHGKAFVEEKPESLAAKALEGFCHKIIAKLPVEEIEENEGGMEQ